MPLTDRFDLPLTSAAPAAVEDYVAAVDLLLSANIGAEELLDRAIAADPDFALAHIARARLLQLGAHIPEAKEAAARAQSLCESVTPRERRHVEAIALTINGAAREALAMVHTHATEYPRDALPLSLALGVFGLLGFSGRRDHHEAQLALLEELAPHWGEDWWFLGYLGWAYIETGEVAKGTRLVELSLAGNPRNAHAAHQRVHGFFESGDAAGGADFVGNWLKGYDRAGQLHCHLSWHLALFEFALGNNERACAVYLDSIRPAVAQAAPMLVWPTRRHFCGAGASMKRPRRSTTNGSRSSRMHSATSRAPASPLPISTPLSRKPRPVTKLACGAASRGCRASTGMAACRQAKSHPLLRRVLRRSAVATTPRRRECSSQRSSSCRGSAAATPSARSSRIP